MRDLPLLPEQLLLHPPVVAAHLLPRQLSHGQELDLQCGALDADDSRHRLRLLPHQPGALQGL